MKRLFKRLIALVFPATCLSCRRDLSPEDRPGLCAVCWKSIPRIESPFCQRCGLPLPDGGARCLPCRRKEGGPLKKIRSAARYDSPLREALRQFKYHQKTYLAGTLGELLYEIKQKEPDLAACSYVIPVPMHPRKQKKQGFNHAELLAKELCERTGQTLRMDCLVRMKTGPSQTELSRNERLLNVAGAFGIKESRKGNVPKKVLLIDDVCTTGATLEECARALKAAGCRQVFALTVAREVPNRPGAASTQAQRR